MGVTRRGAKARRQVSPAALASATSAGLPRAEVDRTDLATGKTGLMDEGRPRSAQAAQGAHPSSPARGRALRLVGGALAFLGAGLLLKSFWDLVRGGGPESASSLILHLVPGPAFILAGLFAIERGRSMEPLPYSDFHESEPMLPNILGNAMGHIDPYGPSSTTVSPPAGWHSGDSAVSIPSASLTSTILGSGHAPAEMPPTPREWGAEASGGVAQLAPAAAPTAAMMSGGQPPYQQGPYSGFGTAAPDPRYPRAGYAQPGQDHPPSGSPAGNIPPQAQFGPGPGPGPGSGSQLDQWTDPSAAIHVSGPVAPIAGRANPVVIETYRAWVTGQTLGHAAFQPLAVRDRFDEWFLLSASGVASLLAWTHEDHGATYSADTWVDQILPSQGISIADRELAMDLLRAAALHAGGLHTAPTERLMAYHPADLVTAMGTLHVGLLRLYSSLEGVHPGKVLRDQLGDGQDLTALPPSNRPAWLPPGS